MPDRQPFPIPADIDPPRHCLCIEVPWTDDHKRVLAGLLWELTQWFNWQRDEAKSGKELASVYRDVFLGIDWTDMSCCCNQTIPILQRIDPENIYNMQISYDGGDTWITNPNQAYNNVVPLPPPVMDEHHTNCDAASNALQHVKDLVAAQIGAMEGSGIITEIALVVAQALIGIILSILVEGPIAALTIMPIIINAIAAISALGIVAFTDYWTTDNYDIILCAFFCNIQEDGTYTSGGFAAAMGELATNLPDSAAKDWLITLLNTAGLAGFNNMAAYGASADADCGSCSCGDECADIDDWVGASPGVLGTITDRTSTTITVASEFYSGFGEYVAYINAGHPEDFDICCVCTNISVDGVSQPGATECCPCGEDGYTTGIHNQSTPTLGIPVNVIGIRLGSTPGQVVVFTFSA
jgi:hypothetical protein